MQHPAAFWIGAGVTLAALVACGGRDSASRRAETGGATTALGGRSARAGSGGSLTGNGGRGGSETPSAAGFAGGATESGGTDGTSDAGVGGEPASGGDTAAGANVGGTSHGGMPTGGSAGTGVPTAVNLFLMIDDSWSMNECPGADADPGAGSDLRCMTGPSRWALVSQALVDFTQDPAAEGLGVALRFFPSDLPVAGCDGYPTTTNFGGAGASFFGGTAGAAGSGSGGTSGGAAGAAGSGGAVPVANCNAAACSVPLVELARLSRQSAPADTQEAALVTAIETSGPPDTPMPSNPNPETPTSAALAGATAWAKAYQAAHPSESTSIVLVTDGEPQGCDTNSTNIALLANDAYMSSGVRTFVIGVGQLNRNALDMIAAAGGTKQAFFLTDGASITADLLAALNAIRSGTTP